MRKSQRKSGNTAGGKPISNTVLLYQNYLVEKKCIIPEQLIEKYHKKGIEVNPDEMNELHNFHTFISSHVKPNNIRNTPCMLLWAEWVRFYLKEMHTFPHLILEREFRDLVTSKFEFDVWEDETRGLVYPGIQFVSRKNISLNVIDRESARA